MNINRKKLLRIRADAKLPPSARLVHHEYNIIPNDHCFIFQCDEWPEVPAGESLPRMIADVTGLYVVLGEASYWDSAMRQHALTLATSFDGDSASQSYTSEEYAQL